MRALLTYAILSGLMPPRCISVHFGALRCTSVHFGAYARYESVRGFSRKFLCRRVFRTANVREHSANTLVSGLDYARLFAFIRVYSCLFARPTLLGTGRYRLTNGQQ